MKKGRLHNLVYLYGKTKVNPLLYIFVYFSLTTGLAFMALTFMGTNHGLTMYQVMLESAGHSGTMLWGFMCFMAAVGVVLSLMYRKRWIAETAAFLGFGLWFYLGWVYGINGYFDGIFMTVVPNVCFWVWFSFMVEWVRRVLCK